MRSFGEIVEGLGVGRIVAIFLIVTALGLGAEKLWFAVQFAHQMVVLK